MASIYKDFWINRAESRLQASRTNTAFLTGLSFKRGDTVQMDICLVEQDGSTYANVPFANTATIKAAIGMVDTAPTSGYFVVSYDGVESGTINYDATATAIQTTLNAVSTIASAGGVTVAIVGNQYRVSFNNVGAKDTLEWVSDTFLPPSTTRITVLDAGSATSRCVQVIKLVSQPFAYTDSFTDIPPATASVTTVSPWANGKSVYNVSWSTTALAGTITFTVNSTVKQIPFDADITDWATAGYTAVKVGINSFDVTVSTPSVATVSVDDALLHGRKGLRGIIGLNTAELEAYFTSNESINAYLEIEVLDGGVKDTAVQHPVVIYPDIINGAEVEPTPVSVCATEAQFIALAADVAVAEGNALAAQTASSNALILAQNLEIDVETLQSQMPSSDVRDALAAANAPTVLNPFATVADLGGGGAGGPFLALAGGTMTGAITFDGTSGQYISKGNFDTSRGGNYGISLVCSVGYEFNWQAGYLMTTQQSGTTPRSLYLDSEAGTTLRCWDSNVGGAGVEITHTGITFRDASIQTTAGLPLAGGAMNTNAEVTIVASAGTDSELGGWGFGVQLTSDNTRYATVEYNQVTVNGNGGQTRLTESGITFPDNTSLTTAPTPPLVNGDYYWLFVDRIENYTSYCHIHHTSSGGVNFPKGFNLWFTESLTSMPIGTPSSYQDGSANVPYAVNVYGGYLELWWYAFDGQVKYANSRLFS